MLIQTKASDETRRLELDGYSRQGSRAVEADLSDLPEILDRDDVTVKKAVVHRNNGDDEQELVDRFIRDYSGRVRQCYVHHSPHAGHSFDVRTRKLANVNEERVAVYTDFRAVLVDREMRETSTTEDEFEEMCEDAVESLVDERERIEREIDRIANLTLDDVLYE